jgi:hypothetical protein
MPGNLQGFQIQPVQSTDPLQTLSQMSQLRTQGLQQQQAQLGVNQAQMQLDSNKGLMQAVVQGGADWDKTYDIASKDGRVLPGDLMKIAQERLTLQTLGSTLKKDQAANLATDMDRYRGFLDGVTDQDSLDQANANAVRAGVAFASPKDAPGGPPKVPLLTTFPGDAAHITAFANSLRLHTQAVEEGLKGAQTTEATGKAAAEQRTQAIADIQAATDPTTGVPSPPDYQAIQKKYPNVSLPSIATPGNIALFTRSGVPVQDQPKLNLERRAQAVSELQAAEQDPKTGGPTPAAMAQIRQKYPDVQLPMGPVSNDDIARLARSAVPIDKQPEYDLAVMKAKFGLLGNTPSDQFLAKYAQTIKNPDGTPKTTLQLTSDEMGQALQKFKTYDTNPEALQALLTARSTENFVKLLSIGQTQAETGPEAVQGWVDTLKQNPDAVSDLPPKLRGQVQREFNSQTGLPLPVKASAQNVTSETAARNALDGIDFIRTALKNPEIKANLGPILGRLGQIEQTFGSAPNLSPQAAALAQELRTRMRYFVFQEGKAVLGGRLPQNLMSELESSSPSPKMSPSLLEGALNGAEGNAQEIIQNVDRQRFGGKYRTPEQRGDTTTGGAPRGAAGGGGIPPKPASIPPNAITHYYPPDNTFYFSIDGGKTWRKIPAK